MIRKNEESGKTSFKKFSEMGKNEKVKQNPAEEILPMEEKDIPGNPNLPITANKKPKNASTRYLKPMPDEQDYDKEDNSGMEEPEVNEDKKVKLYGKVAKLPNGTKASKGFNFLENVKISKNSIWYIMVEKQQDELQMVKYNHKKGVDLSKFINELKEYYSKKYSKNKKVLEMISNISVDGNDKYSWVKNIPLVEVDGRKMISHITEDLIKLLSK